MRILISTKAGPYITGEESQHAPSKAYYHYAHIPGVPPDSISEKELNMTRLTKLLIASTFAASAVFPSAVLAAEQVVVVVRTFPAEGREDELQARSLKQIEFLRKAEPTATFRLHRSAKAPITFLWYEVYESQAAHDNHLKVVVPNFVKEFGRTPDGLYARPPEIASYIELAK